MKTAAPTKPAPKAALEKELIKAKAREQVSQRKLDRLKERFEKLQAEGEAQSDRWNAERERWENKLQKLDHQKKKLAVRCKTLQDEAGMWKSQLFEQMDRLEEQRADFTSVRAELTEAQWQLVELVEAERTQREIELAKAQAETFELRRELTAARAQADGLRNVGSCLTAKLEKAVAQRKVLQREHIRLSELVEERTSLLEQRDQEIEALKMALFEARGQILTHRLESETWPVLAAGLHHEAPAEESQEDWEFEETPLSALGSSLELHPSRERRPLKLAAFPSASSSVTAVGARQLLHRAGKTVGGWFKLGGKA